MRSSFGKLLGFAAVGLMTLAAYGYDVKVIVSANPIGGARIDPKLFGNFIELLEDVVPGTWAEMLNDRSFEGVTPAANWCYFDGSPTICDREWDKNETWEREAGHAFNGQQCARITATDLRTGTLTQSDLAVTKGTRYQFSGYFRAENADLEGAIVLRTLLPDGSWMELASAKLPRMLPEWQKCALDLTSSGTSDHAVFELRLSGHGSLWADRLSLMPANNAQGWRQDVVQAIQEVRPAVIRWGGSTCDPGEYRWKNGIGDRDHRVPFPNKVWGRIDSNDVGIDEFCQFCELVRAEPMICLSFSDGPESAADLVEYCNGSPDSPWGSRRVGNGHPSAYHVRYWQVGNEINGDDKQYLARMGEFVRLMKAKDPSLELCSSFPSKKLVETFGPNLAFICPHHYTTDFEACDRELTELTHLLGTVRGCEQTRIAVTEWNTSGGDWGLMRGRQMTLQAALLNARYLHLLMRHADRVKMACRSNLANSFCGAIIETSPSGLLKRPSYHVMQLYATHAKPLALPLSQSTNSLDLFACASDSKSALVIFGVNSGTEPVKAGFEFAGFPGPVRITSAEAVGDLEDARQPDLVNHWNVPERVSTRSVQISQNEMSFPAFSVVAVECGTF
jgi:alpha-N-arabinofuranosidase